MTFKLTRSKIDIGETPIENIFINNFMNLADEIQLKVYILGLQMAHNNSDTSTNQEIAKHLGVEIKKVDDAWNFWKAIGLVDFDEKKKNHMGEFDIRFISPREKYISSNYNSKTNEDFHDKELNIISDPEVLKMFDKAENIIGTPLKPDDRIKILDWINEYNTSNSMFLRALKITYIENPPEKPGLKYVKGIISKWQKNGIKTESDAESFEKAFSKKSEFYKTINSHLLGKTNLPTKAQITIIEKWLTIVNDEKVFIEVVDFCSTNYVYPTYKRLNSIFEKIEQNCGLSLQGIHQYLDSSNEKTESKKIYSTSKKENKNKQNFSQDKYKKMSSEDGITILKKNNPALQNRRKK